MMFGFTHDFLSGTQVGMAPASCAYTTPFEVPTPNHPGAKKNSHASRDTQLWQRRARAIADELRFRMPWSCPSVGDN